MKRKYLYILFPVIMLAFWYFVVGFTIMEWNPNNMTAGNRIVIALFITPVILIGVFIANIFNGL